MALLERRVEPVEIRGTERAFEVRLGSLGGVEVRPTRLFVWQGGQRSETEKILPLADKPVGLDYSRTESTVRVGALELRSRGNPLMTLAMAGAVAFKRWADPDRDSGAAERRSP